MTSKKNLNYDTNKVISSLSGKHFIFGKTDKNLVKSLFLFVLGLCCCAGFSLVAQAGATL